MMPRIAERTITLSSNSITTGYGGTLNAARDFTISTSADKLDISRNNSDGVGNILTSHNLAPSIMTN